MGEWHDEAACPHCGHALSMWEPPEPDRTERVALWVASHVASWAFPALVFGCLTVWVGINVIWQPFEPYPVIIFAVTSAVLATVAALQGPLILTAQRRSAQRDRLRDEETLRVSSHTEADIHRLELQVQRLIDLLEAKEN